MVFNVADNKMKMMRMADIEGKQSRIEDVAQQVVATTTDLWLGTSTEAQTRGPDLEQRMTPAERYSIQNMMDAYEAMNDIGLTILIERAIAEVAAAVAIGTATNKV